MNSRTNNILLLHTQNYRQQVKNIIWLQIKPNSQLENNDTQDTVIVGTDKQPINHQQVKRMNQDENLPLHPKWKAISSLKITS